MKNTQSAHFDNIATASHPVWRKRVRKPFTCRAVRQQLIAQAADLPIDERQLYVSRRLTALDKALDDDEAEALEAWLDAEEILTGRCKIGDYGDRTGGGSGRASPVPDSTIAMLRDHAMRKRSLSLDQRRALHILLPMRGDREWDYASGGRILLGGNLDYAKAKRAFLSAARSAAATLAKLHSAKNA